MFERRYFEYNGQSSRDFGLILVHDGGLFERPFGENRSAITEAVYANPVPYFFGFESQPLSGDTQFYSLTPWTHEKRQAVAKWLFYGSYAPFVSADHPDVVYYLLFSGEQSLQSGIGRRGYLTLHFECNAPWGWSKQIVQEYDLRFNTDTFTFDINHTGNVDAVRYNPLEIEIQIPKFDESDYPDAAVRPAVDVSDLQFTLRNTRNTRPEDAFVLKSTSLASLQKGETVYIHMGKRKVMSDAGVFSRMDNCNKRWISLEYGYNTIEITGRCVLRVRCQFPILC